MLYEVITIDTLQYDDFTNLKFAGFKQPDSLKIGTLESGKIIDAINRITSYNVCYTKLLRQFLNYQVA